MLRIAAATIGPGSKEQIEEPLDRAQPTPQPEFGSILITLNPTLHHIVNIKSFPVARILILGAS